jgi:hypothetical protein
MAIFGVGAFYDGRTDVSMDFLKRGVACVGWPKEDAPPLHNLLRRLHVGDIVYIKAHPPGRKLTVKAVGIVTNDNVTEHVDLGFGVPVKWIWRGSTVIAEAANERYNVRNNTLYEEMSPEFQSRILKLLFKGMKS